MYRSSLLPKFNDLTLILLKRLATESRDLVLTKHFAQSQFPAISCHSFDLVSTGLVQQPEDLSRIMSYDRAPKNNVFPPYLLLYGYDIILVSSNFQGIIPPFLKTPA